MWTVLEAGSAPIYADENRVSTLTMTAALLKSLNLNHPSQSPTLKSDRAGGLGMSQE